MRYTNIRCLIVCLTLNSAPPSLAANRRVEGEVKAVHAEKSTITLAKDGAEAKDETLNVAKMAKLTVNGKAAALKDVRRGLRAVAVVDDELEVVKALDATGEGAAPFAPGITSVDELPNADLDYTGPWPTDDGLTRSREVAVASWPTNCRDCAGRKA
jgi:hypothetical protein